MFYELRSSLGYFDESSNTWLQSPSKGMLPSYNKRYADGTIFIIEKWKIVMISNSMSNKKINGLWVWGSDGQITNSKIEKAARQAQRLDAWDSPRVRKNIASKTTNENFIKQADSIEFARSFERHQSKVIAIPLLGWYLLYSIDNQTQILHWQGFLGKLILFRKGKEYRFTKTRLLPNLKHTIPINNLPKNYST